MWDSLSFIQQSCVEPLLGAGVGLGTEDKTQSLLSDKKETLMIKVEIYGALAMDQTLSEAFEMTLLNHNHLREVSLSSLLKRLGN